MVFIFDECHRSQFGETHANIKKYFTNNQMFGFTGTPIMVENIVNNDFGKRTTEDLFTEPLHKYVITDAIADGNVLKFMVEYVGKYSYKDESKNNLDIDVTDIDTNELLESDDRIEKIANYIIENHKQKTYQKSFNSIFAISNIKTLIRYYDIFRKKYEDGEHDLKIATIFTYQANPDPEKMAAYIDTNNLDQQDFQSVAEEQFDYKADCTSLKKMGQF